MIVNIIDQPAWHPDQLTLRGRYLASALLQPLMTLIRGRAFRKVVGEFEEYAAGGMEK